MEISKTANTNDQLRTLGSIAFGGTLTVTNVAGTFTGGETYKLFNAASYSGTFTTNLPTLPVGMTWNTNNLTVNGTISVSTPLSPTAPASILTVTRVGTNIVLHGTNLNVPNTNFHYLVLTSTNIALPLTNWTPLSTNSFNADGTFDFTNGIVPAQRRLFYDTKAVP
jgi:hypothetical protein